MKYISPLIYLILAFGVAVVIMLAIMFIERNMGLHSIFGRMRDIDFLIALLLLGGPIFFFGSNLLFHIEKTETPTLADHLRQCALLYPLFAFFGIGAIQLVYYFFTIENYNVGMGSVYAFLFSGVAFMGILMNRIAIFFRHTLRH